MYRYRITFAHKSSGKSYEFVVHAACTGNAIACGWGRLADIWGDTSGWSLSTYFSDWS